MATNFIQPGNTLTVTAPTGGVLSGEGMMVNYAFGVAAFDADSGDDVEMHVVGVHELAKTAGQAWSQGDHIYWVVATGACSITASGNHLIGIATEAAASAATVGRVRLKGPPVG